MYRAIVVPLDGFATAERAIPVAARLARASGARVHLVHAVDVLAFPSYAEGSPAAEWWNGGALRLAEAYLKRLAEENGSKYSVTITTELLLEPVAPSVVSYVERIGADLIVSTTHGKSPLKRAWVGSVADELARTAPCPTLFLRASEVVPAERAEDPFTHILVPLDGSPLSESVLPAARELAKTEKARITLLNVWDLHPLLLGTDGLVLPPPLPAYVTSTIDQARTYIERVAADFSRNGLTVQTEVVTADAGSVAATILEYEREHDVDVLALSTRGAGGLRRLLLGSVADKILRTSTNPVLLFRPPES